VVMPKRPYSVIERRNSKVMNRCKDRVIRIAGRQLF
jgi:hypothetical protein